MPDVLLQTTPFREVFDAHGDYVFRLVKHLGVPDRDVEDVLQEVFVVVHRRLPELELRAKLRTWIHAVTWRVVGTYRRTAARKGLTIEPDLAPPAVGADPESEVSQREAMARLDRALASLAPDQREVFLLFEVEQVPMADIVEAMGTPLQTGYSRLRIARARVRAEFEAHEEVA